MAPRRLFILCLFVALWSMAQSVFATELRLATFNVAWLANKPLPSMSMVNLCQQEARRYPELSRRPTPACRTGVFRGAGAYGLLARQVAALQADMIAFQEIEGSEALGRILADGHYQRVGEWRWWVNPLPVHARQRVAIAVRADKVAQMEITALPELGLPLSREARGGLLARWTLPSGETLWVLVVHLKSGCRGGVLDKPAACKALTAQGQWLGAYLDKWQQVGAPLIILGDFNRDLDGEAQACAAGHCPVGSLWPALDRHGLRRTTAGFRLPSGCYPPRYGPAPIDHILLSGPLVGKAVSGALRAHPFLLPDGRGVYARAPAYLSDHCPLSLRLRW